MPRMIINIIVICAILLILILENSFADENNNINYDIKSIVNITNMLKNISVPGGEYTIPNEARPLLKNLKHNLRDIIINILNNVKYESKSPGEIKKIIIDELSENGVQIGNNKVDNSASDYYYGRIYDISVNNFRDHSDLMAVTTTVGICCGEDTSFYLFEKGVGWTLILAQEVNDYDTIDDAQGSFGYGILSSEKENLSVVTVNINPWCTSNWQKIRYSILRVSNDAYEPEYILNENNTIYLGVDPPLYDLKVEKNKFILKYYGGDDLNPDGTAPEQYVEYLVRNNKATRIKH